MKKQLLIITVLCILMFSCKQNTGKVYDIIVYGGTSSGVIAAYSARLEGKKVLLVEPGKHLGGLSSSGLGQTDIGNKYAVTGIARNFYRRLGDHYGKLEAWKFEPHAAEAVFNEYINEAGVDLLYGYRLKDVRMRNKRIQSIQLEPTDASNGSDKEISGSYFIDCSYEGDLMAKAGVSYTVGRESNDTYGETYNGVQLRDLHQFPDSIDPYIVEGDPSSGLCQGIQAVGLAPQGSGDTLVQAYNYRLCLTQDTTNMVSIAQPENYDASRFELLRRVIKRNEKLGIKQNLYQFLIISPMPNGKTDINNKGPVSTDGIGMNYAYPEGSYEVRAQIASEVEQYTKEFLYFLGHDEGVPENVRRQMLAWGWAADEFTDNGNFPHEMYIREARRIIGEYVMTQHNCVGDSTVDDGIGLAAYTMDSHNCQRVVVNGMVKNEGDVEIGGFPPYEISYRSLTPKRTECENLLVPVCLSASHIAFGSIRMEPVFMVLGQVTGLASAMALDGKVPVQEIDITALNKRLRNDPLQNGTPPDIIVDNSDSSQVLIEGPWKIKSAWMRQNKADHLFHSAMTAPGSVTFKPVFPDSTEVYKAFLYIPGKAWEGDEEFDKYSENVKVEIRTGDEDHEVVLDINPYTFDWAPLGTYSFSKGDYVRVEAGMDKYPVPADAVLLVPQNN